MRPLDAGDAAAFQAIRLEAIADAPTAVWPTAAEEAARTLAEITARIVRTEHQFVLGAFAGVSLVGIAGLRREPLV